MKNWLMIPETTDRTIEPNKAGQKPLTVKPGVKYPTIDRVMALITNRNRPKDRIVSGKVRRVRMGLTIALTNPMTATAIAAACQLAIVKPGTRYAVIARAIAARTQVRKKLSMVFVVNPMVIHNFSCWLALTEMGDALPLRSNTPTNRV